MQLYDALRRKKTLFTPGDGAVTVYVCGITPYDTTHLGHAFTYSSFDVLIRYLEYQGLTVRYAENVTDIDDDILRKAREGGDDWRRLGNRWTAHFIRDMIEMNIRPPDFYPGATDVIPEILQAVQNLIARGVAYEAGGSVYFHIAEWPTYGVLSGIPKDQMLPIANERGNRPDDPLKRDPLDFVLWQAQAPGEPAWQSPWGMGRPGWHIECSTMAAKYLGQTVDIHGGGADLIYPHHESEIAQAEAGTGKHPFVRFWMHTAMVCHEGEKMSKSLGNLVMVSDLLKTYSPDALRVYLARHHYRETWSYDKAEMDEAQHQADQLGAAVAVVSRSGTPLSPVDALGAFRSAMDDDLNTGAALQALTNLAARLVGAAPAGADVRSAQAAVRELSHVFGLRLDAQAPEARVSEGWNQHLTRFA
jgi:cysteinyl-tRNA synthetase